MKLAIFGHSLLRYPSDWRYRRDDCLHRYKLTHSVTASSAWTHDTFICPICRPTAGFSLGLCILRTRYYPRSLLLGGFPFPFGPNPLKWQTSSTIQLVEKRYRAISNTYLDSLTKRKRRTRHPNPGDRSPMTYLIAPCFNMIFNLLPSGLLLLFRKLVYIQWDIYLKKPGKKLPTQASCT